MNKDDFVVRAGVMFCILGVFFVMPFFLLLYPGYYNHVKKNGSLNETDCNITGHDIKKNTCSKSCNCRQTCSGSDNSRSCTTTCDTCSYPCYSGYILLRHFLRGKNYEGWVCVYNDYEWESQVVSLLNKNYPIGSKITCYYDIEHANEIRLDCPFSLCDHIHSTWWDCFPRMGRLRNLQTEKFIWVLKNPYKILL